MSKQWKKYLIKSTYKFLLKCNRGYNIDNKYLMNSAMQNEWVVGQEKKIHWVYTGNCRWIYCTCIVQYDGRPVSTCMLCKHCTLLTQGKKRKKKEISPDIWIN